MRRWRFALLVLALVSVIGIGAAVTHGAFDATEPAAASNDHADTCILVGLVCALVVATVGQLRAVRPPRAARWLAAPLRAPWRRPSSPSGVAGSDRAPSPACLCRFLS
jgi:hypothetical protein